MFTKFASCSSGDLLRKMKTELAGFDFVQNLEVKFYTSLDTATCWFLSRQGGQCLPKMRKMQEKMQDCNMKLQINISGHGKQ